MNKEWITRNINYLVAITRRAENRDEDHRIKPLDYTWTIWRDAERTLKDFIFDFVNSVWSDVELLQKRNEEQQGTIERLKKEIEQLKAEKEK